MNLQRFSLSLFSLALSATAFAQQAGVTLPGPGRVIKADTIIIPKASRPPAAPVALAAACIQQPVLKKLSGMKTVPLAGTKEYYGKNGAYVNSFVRSYLGAHAKTLVAVKARSAKRFKQVETVLAKHRIPKELKYLAVIESALNNQAVSCAGAVGPWQFMEGTARDFGLTVNETVDERTDWNRSTNAAAKYLKQLYGQMNDWLLVVASYNSGPVPVQRAIQKTGSRDFWTIKKYLPRETQGHVLAFIATATIFENLNKYIGAGRLPTDFKFADEIVDLKVVKIDTVKPIKPRFTKVELEGMAIVRINEPVHFDYLVQELAMDRKLLEKWNPDYDLFVYNSYSEPYYGLRIPKDKLDSFIEKKETILKRSKEIFGDEVTM